MADKIFMVELTGGAPGDPGYVQPVRAEQVVEDEEYLQFIGEKGELGGLFLRSVVKIWRLATEDEASKMGGHEPAAN